MFSAVEYLRAIQKITEEMDSKPSIEESIRAAYRIRALVETAAKLGKMDKVSERDAEWLYQMARKSNS